MLKYSSPTFAVSKGMKWLIIFISLLNISTAMADGKKNSSAVKGAKNTSNKKVKPVNSHKSGKIRQRSSSKSTNSMYPLSTTWPDGIACEPDADLNARLLKSHTAKLVKEACIDKERTTGDRMVRRKPECLIPTFKLAAEAFGTESSTTKTPQINYPLVQCIFGQETSDPKQVAGHVERYMCQQENALKNQAMDHYDASASKGNGRGLGQLTPDAKKAVQELLDPNLKNGIRFDCKVQQAFVAFFNAIEQPIPDIVITKDKKEKVPYSDEISTHNIAVSVAYLYDVQNNILPHKHPEAIKPRKEETAEKYLDRINELTARTYNSAKNAISYGESVRLCAKEVRTVNCDDQRLPSAALEEAQTTDVLLKPKGDR